MTPSETAEWIARAIGRASWFAAVGDRLTDAEVDDATLYLSGIGRAGIAVAGVSTWTEAKAIADDPKWDREWWGEEERLRAELTRKAVDGYSQSAVHEALGRIASVATETVQGAAAVAASRFGIADLALIKSAAGAATQACHHAALARMAARAADDDDPFEVKFRLFEGGRWPLAIVRDTYYIL